MDNIASGLSLTNTNYKQALDVFFEKYSQNHNHNTQALIYIQLLMSNPDFSMTELSLH